jgi:hypothetical protein
MCPMSKDKLYVKLIFKKEQAQNQMCFISRKNMYSETREGVLSELLRNHKHVSTNSVPVK